MNPLANPAASAPGALGAPSPAAPRKLEKAAQQFEGILISTLWSSMQNDPLTGSEGDDSDPGADSLKSLGLQAMSTALSARGGLGLATMIEHQLAPRAAGAPAGAALQPLKSGQNPDDTRTVARLPQSATVEERR
ncbi:MAG: hypothetical protein ACRD1E_10420 [Terriglobales bacterium]